MRICVSGAGYVGLSNAVLLTQHNQVVDMLTARQSPIEDPEPEHYLATVIHPPTVIPGSTQDPSRMDCRSSPQ